LDEVFIKVSGELKYLWRAAGADGNVLDILVQSRRDKAAARCFFRRLMKKTRAVPRVVVTDRLRSCGAAHREALPSVEHRSHKSLNNRAENSHQPTRQRERAMKGFRSTGGAQRTTGCTIRATALSSWAGPGPCERPGRGQTAPDWGVKREGGAYRQRVRAAPARLPVLRETGEAEDDHGQEPVKPRHSLFRRRT
jgi:putative transposase